MSVKQLLIDFFRRVCRRSYFAPQSHLFIPVHCCKTTKCSTHQSPRHKHPEFHSISKFKLIRFSKSLLFKYVKLFECKHLNEINSNCSLNQWRLITICTGWSPANVSLVVNSSFYLHYGANISLTHLAWLPSVCLKMNLLLSLPQLLALSLLGENSCSLPFSPVLVCLGLFLSWTMCSHAHSTHFISAPLFRTFLPAASHVNAPPMKELTIHSQYMNDAKFHKWA